MQKKSTIVYNLFILMGIFIFGYSTLVGMHYYFGNKIENLDNKIKNEQARYAIGEYILKEINDIEVKYYKISMYFKKAPALEMKKEIEKEIENIFYAMGVLAKGGKVTKYIQLNMVEKDRSTEYLEYNPNISNLKTYEIIDLKPKILKIEQKLDDIINLIDLKQQIFTNISIHEKKKIRFKIEILLKKLPPHFTRIKENASRLLYESKKNAFDIEQDMKREKANYLNLELILSAIVMLVVCLLGYIISRQIQKSTQKLSYVTQEAKKSAQEAYNANQAKSQFLANMSHEIRTPLSAIIGFSEILATANLPKTQNEHANIITTSAKALLSIINDILDLSKVESGKLELVDERFNADLLYEQIVELFAVSAKQKNIRFYYNTDANMPDYLLGDSIRIKQVISNLLSNAIKFTPDNGRVLFDIHIKKDLDDSVLLRFSVSDSGIGLSKEQEKKIFEPFTQADDGISRKYGGTGLGLAISLQIIEKMGSKIEVISTEGKGSTFYFDLKLKKEDSYEKESKKLDLKFVITNKSKDTEHVKENLKNYLFKIGEIIDINDINKHKKIDMIFCIDVKINYDLLIEIKKKFPKSKLIYIGLENIDKLNDEFNDIIDYAIETPIYGSKIFNVIAECSNIEEKNYAESQFSDTLKGNILVAEDNINNQQLIRILLEKNGLTCTIANNGKEAVEFYQKNDFDMIFMDINMPVMDGLTALKEIRCIEEKTNIHKPIVALTANMFKGDKEKFLEAGMDDYMTKPIDMIVLISMLNKYLYKKQTIENIEPPIEAKVEQITSTYDKNVVIKKMMLDEDIVNMLIDNFMLTLESSLEDIANAIEEKDAEKIYQKVHFLRGSCANLMMEVPQQILNDMEDKAREGVTDNYDMASLYNSFESIKKSLE